MFPFFLRKRLRYLKWYDKRKRFYSIPVHFLDPDIKKKLRTLDPEIRNHLRISNTLCKVVVFRHMENLQHQLIVTPTLVPLSASLTARNRTHAHVAKTGFGWSLICLYVLDEPMSWFFMQLLCFLEFFESVVICTNPVPDLDHFTNKQK